MSTYTPNQQILSNFANLLVNFALNSGAGIKKGDVVNVLMNEHAKPILFHVQKAILESGGHMLLTYLPAELERDRDETRLFFEIANEEQLNFFPENYIQAKINLIDHLIFFYSTNDHHYYDGIDQTKLAIRSKAWKPYTDFRDDKELDGKFTWTLTDYPTPAMAEAANMSLQEYWEQIIKACHLDLDKDECIEKNKESLNQITLLTDKINSLNIDTIHITGTDMDLTVKIGESRRWLGGTGRNIPSFEIFTSPDNQGVDGWIKFNQPLYRLGQIINGIELHFEKGKVVRYSAKENEEALCSMLETDEGASRVGEISLTDKRFSRIDRIMATTLYDENFGGEFGNTHLAIGKSYKDTYSGDFADLTEEKSEELRFNQSAIHVDIMSTTNRKVTAILKNGEEILLYEDGEFKIL